MLVVCGSELEKNAESLERVESWELKNYQGKKKRAGKCSDFGVEKCWQAMRF